MSPQIDATGTVRIINCTIGDETYCLEMSWVKSILRMDRMQQAPSVNDEFTNEAVRLKDLAGWVNVSGEDIPVFPLERILGRSFPLSSGTGGANSRVIVLQDQTVEGRGARRSWALLVHRVSQVIQVEPEKMTSLRRLSRQMGLRSFEAVIRQESSMSLLLRPDRLNPLDQRAGNEPVEERTCQESDKPFVSGRLQEKGGAEAGRMEGYGRIMIFSPVSLKEDGKNIVFGLSIAQIMEVLRPLPIVPVPMAPGYLLGLVQWRERPVPLINLESRMGMQTRSATFDNSVFRMMIIQGAEPDAYLAIRIQPDMRGLKFPVSCTASHRPLAVNRSMVRTVVELVEDTLVIPDIGQVLPTSPS